MITNYINYITEFKSEDIKLILSDLQEYFTIGFEIELEFKGKIKDLKFISKNESHIMYPSIKNRKILNDYKICFPDFYNKYKDIIIFHEDETLLYGVEIINKPFTNLDEALNYIQDFFDSYNTQDRWKFNDRTSIHVNIGSKGKKWNLTKGITMISDQSKGGFVYKGIEDRLVNWCGSIKEKLIKDFKKKPENILDTTNIDEIESIISKSITKYYSKTTMRHGMILKGESEKYMEFRYVGGENLNSNIVEDKILYFCYIAYLMTSDYRKREYVRKLFSFINKLRSE